MLRAEAEGDLSEYDMSPGSPAYVLAARLEALGLVVSPLDAADAATRLLDEVDKASAAKVEYEKAVHAMTGPAAVLVEQRQRAIDQRSMTERKVATQNQLLRLAKAQLTAGGGHKPRGLMPVLLEEPFADLPEELTDATLAMLLRHSEAAQVLIVSRRSDVATWCNQVDGDAGCVDVTGWFAEEHSEW